MAYLISSSGKSSDKKKSSASASQSRKASDAASQTGKSGGASLSSEDDSDVEPNVCLRLVKALAT
ncbi:hypothetical protein Tco_0609879, partial [Tanacetum coccineum]